MTSRMVQIGAAFLVGVIVTFGAQHLEPAIGRTLFESSFRRAYLDCALSEQHAELYKKLRLSDEMAHQIEKTLEVEGLSCVDYATLKLKLKSFRVDDPDIAAIELAAFSSERQLRCANHCSESALKVGVP